MRPVQGVVRSAFLLLLAALLLAGDAQSQVPPLPPQDPQLRIDPGMHTGKIKRISVDAACTLLVTASDDKTVRLWRLPQGKLLRTLRPPIGRGNDGKVYSVAMAPDGSWIAAGGWDVYADERAENAIYVFQAATGALMARLGPLKQVVHHMTVSPDGRYLAAMLGGGEGLRIWERTDSSLTSWRLVAEDRKYGGEASYGAIFDANGTLFTVGYDGMLRRYAAGYKSVSNAIVLRGGRRPSPIAVHPAGDRLAVGFQDSKAVDVYDAATLAWRFSADTTDVDNGTLSSVVWSADGERLYAGGQYDKGGHSQIRVWDRSGQGRAQDFDGPKDLISSMQACGNDIAIAAADPAFGLFTPAGTRRLWQDNVQVDMRNKLREHLTVSTNGMRVRFGLTYGGQDPVLFDLTAERLSDTPELPADLFPSDIKSLDVTNWEDRPNPTLSGKPLQLDKHEMARSLAIAPDKERFILGTEWRLRAYDKAGKPLWQMPVPGVVWGVNIPRDGKLVVAAYGDGTVRWHRLSDGEELLALFVHAKDRRWVAWTPKGYYAASAGGDNLVGWHVNRGWNEAADFFPVSKYRDTFYRPDIIARILADLNEEKAVTHANLAINKQREDEDIRKRQPPVVRILSPLNASNVFSDELVVEFNLRSPSGLPIKRVFAQIDGRPVEGAEILRISADARQEITRRLKVNVPPRDVTISIIAETENAVSEPASVDLLRLGGAKSPIQPRLFALIVGVGDYPRDALKLGTFPGNDADDLAGQLKRQEGEGLAYKEVKIRILKDSERGSEATLQNIKTGLSWLRQMAESVDDIALVYFSGHGVSIPGSTSYLLPVDYDGDVDVTALDKTAMLNTLRRINGKVIVFVDACYAADSLELVNIRGARRLDTAGLVSEFADSQNGIIAFASSAGTERSYAVGRNSHFTKALIEGLLGHAAPRTGDKVILTDDLIVWLRRRVDGLSQGKQTPIMTMSPQAKPVPVAVVP